MAASSSGDGAARHEELLHRSTRGGRLQRRAIEQLLSNDLPPHPVVLACRSFDSALAEELVHGWAWGMFSACEVQRLAIKSFEDQQALLARLNLADTHASESLRALAGLGNSGRQPNNVAHQLRAWLGEPSIPSPFYASIDVLITKPRSSQRVLAPRKMPFMLPHYNKNYNTTTIKYDKTTIKLR